MSWPNAFSVASTVSAVPGGPMIGSGAGSGAKVVIHRVISRSPRSAMWSLCRWVSSSADNPAAPTPTAAARCSTPRPQSTRNTCPPARTRVDGPARFGSGMGLPVPSNVISIMALSLQAASRAQSHWADSPSRAESIATVGGFVRDLQGMAVMVAGFSCWLSRRAS